MSKIITANLLANGKVVTIEYGFHPTLFGPCLVAIAAGTSRVCHLSFVSNKQKENLADLQAAWPATSLQQNTHATAWVLTAFFMEKQPSIPLLVQGTSFQVRVWKTLLTIPLGKQCTYEAVAQQMHQPTAVRAVASSMAKNRIALLIPCHRVIRKAGAIGQYRWGTARKKSILAWEARQQ